jgi:hypothetical protein
MMCPSTFPHRGRFRNTERLDATARYLAVKPKTRKRAVISGGATPRDRVPLGRRPAKRSGSEDDVALETYEQPPRRGTEDARAELSRRPVREERTARDEP